MKPASRQRNRAKHKLSVKRRTNPRQVKARKRRMRRARVRAKK